MMVVVGLGVLVEKIAHGVRKMPSQGGLVRIAGSRGSNKLRGLPVRKSLLGSMFDSMLAGNLQRGEKRSAHPLVRMMQMNPKMRIRSRMIMESRRSLSFSRVVVMGLSIYREAHKDCGARVGLFVVP